MRVNVYAEEMTDRIEIISKEIDGHRFTGLRLYLELPATVNGQQYQGPFVHRPGDDDSSAVTFWGKRDLRVVLRQALSALDQHYATSHPSSDVQVSSGTQIPEQSGARSAPSEDQLLAIHKDQVEWVVNDNAELGVKIGNQFFWLYKGYSFVYGDSKFLDEVPPDGICKHNDGTPMHWRHAHKREFGECCHPVNYKDPTSWGTVNLNDSPDWKPLPAPHPSSDVQNGASEDLPEEVRQRINWLISPMGTHVTREQFTSACRLAYRFGKEQRNG